MKIKLLLMTLIFSTATTQADYIVVGKQEAVSHPWSGFFTEVNIVTNYKNKDTPILQLPKIYPDSFINEFYAVKEKNKGRCKTIHTKSTNSSGGEFMDMAINYVGRNYIGNMNTYYEFKNNKYNEVDADFLTFECIKR